MSAAMIAEALGGASRSGGWWRCRCPVHGSRGSTLAIRDAPSGIVLHCHAGCSHDAVRDELRRLGLLASDERSRVAIDSAEIKRQRADNERRRQQRVAAAAALWHYQTVDPHGTVVERYWLSRGLSLPLPLTIRASRNWMQHPEGGSRPTMVALVEHVEHDWSQFTGHS